MKNNREYPKVCPALEVISDRINRRNRSCIDSSIGIVYLIFCLIGIGNWIRQARLCVRCYTRLISLKVPSRCDVIALTLGGRKKPTDVRRSPILSMRVSRKKIEVVAYFWASCFFPLFLQNEAKKQISYERVSLEVFWLAYSYLVTSFWTYLYFARDYLSYNG